MIRSFRFQLAARVAGGVAVGLAILGVLSYAQMRASLDRQINASLVNIASIQASSVAQPDSPKMAFHEWALTPGEAASVLDLNRYAEVWTAGGKSLLRTRYLTRDLPLDTAALARAGRGHLVWAEQHLGDIPVRSLYYPLSRVGPAHAHHILQVAAPLVARNATLRRFALMLIALIVLAGAGMFAGSWWLAARVSRPVDEIIDQTEDIGARTLGRRIRSYAETREYQRLINVLNTMLERLDRAFDAQRRFTADASHELRSPLTALQGELELALRRERDGVEYRRVIGSALEEARRLSRTAEDLLTLARSDAGVLRPRLRAGDVADVARHAAERLQPLAAAKGIELALDGRPAPEARLDPELAERLAYNLIENAIKYTPAGGRVRVFTGPHDGGAELRVEDTGPGLPTVHPDSLFDRFFRADDSRTPAHDVGGAGLGLSIVRAIADAHAANLRADNRPGGGAAFSVIFGAEATGSDVEPDEPQPPERTGRESDGSTRATGIRSSAGT